MATLRQEKAFRLLSEYVRNSPELKGLTLGKILLEAGYSQSTSESPQRVTNTKGWRHLLDTYFPDDLITRKHLALLEKEEVFHHKGELVKTGQPHSDTKYALTLLYKLKSVYKKLEQPPVENDLDYIDKLSDEDLNKMLEITEQWDEIYDKYANQDTV